MELPFLGKKKGEEESNGRGFVPTERVSELMSRGFSELDTIDVLRREGFSPDEIDKGLTQAIKEGVVGQPDKRNDNFDATNTGDEFEHEYQQFRGDRTKTPSTPEEHNRQASFPPKKQQRNDNEGDFRLPTMEDLELPSSGNSPQIPETSLPEEYYEGYPTEEYVDYVVQERTGELLSQMNELILKNKELESRLKEMSDRVGDLSKMRIGEQQQVLNTIEGLTESVNDVNMRVASLEKAFKETLPALIESVRALIDLVQRMKREA